MACISDFGIGSVARTLAWRLGGLASLAVLSMAAAPPPAPSAKIDVSVSGLRNAKGNVLICLTANAKHFPDCGKDPKALKQSVAASKAGMIQFEGVTPGTYALALVHDENANNKMDVTVFLPKEGFAFSRNPAVVFGPPKFGAARFVVTTGEQSQRVTMKYML
jgi:uncharacterized protein (DUF2141 family)